MEIKIPLQKGEYLVFKFGLERKIESTKLPEGMYEYAIPPTRGIDREHIMRLFGHSDAYLAAFENITGIRIRDRKYY